MSPFRFGRRTDGVGETPPERGVRAGRHPAVSAGRWAVWGALAAGPVALAVALTHPATTVRTVAKAPERGAQGAAQAEDPRGWAALFVDQWLRAPARGEAAGDAVRAMAPGVQLPEWEAADAPRVQRVSSLSSRVTGPGTWSVTVGVQLRAEKKKAAPAPRFFTVPVRAAEGRVSVTAAPAEVAAPRGGGERESAYRTSVESGSALEGTVGDFLTAYLAGDGGAERYLAPKVELPAISPAPYRKVTVEELRAVEDSAREGVPGRDGSRVRVRAQVNAQDAHGAQWPLSYALTLRARDGRWEVAALGAGPEPRPGARSGAQDSSTGARGARPPGPPTAVRDVVSAGRALPDRAAAPVWAGR
ncbi:conjugal transfer protein [Streptomyces nanshensis]|uniref:conjugal transfer protein n=1 Tax=Streptomyces nanshensis TaxID=518642 RepID=UPI00085BE77B|nr:conjugal transfer protein [Streptomyces nanshensis]